MSNKKRNDLITEKHGLTYEQAMKEAMPIASRAARRHHKWVNCASDKDDLLAAAYAQGRGAGFGFSFRGIATPPVGP